MEEYKWSYRRIWETMDELIQQEIIVEETKPLRRAPQFSIVAK